MIPSILLNSHPNKQLAEEMSLKHEAYSHSCSSPCDYNFKLGKPFPSSFLLLNLLIPHLIPYLEKWHYTDTAIFIILPITVKKYFLFLHSVHTHTHNVWFLSLCDWMEIFHKDCLFFLCNLLIFSIWICFPKNNTEHDSLYRLYNLLSRKACSLKSLLSGWE